MRIPRDEKSELKLRRETTKSNRNMNEGDSADSAPCVLDGGSCSAEIDSTEYILERRKNDCLHYLLAKSRENTKSNPAIDGSRNGSSSQSTEQLERTYKKALSDYKLARGQLEAMAASKGKTATGLRSSLNEKEDKAEKLMSTLLKYREDIAKQATFANGKPFNMEILEELESQDLGEELERERLRHITNKVNVSQLEQKLRKKNELAGGVSDIEYQNLEEDISESEQKINCYDAELENMNNNGEKILQLESFLTTAINNYSEKDQMKQAELKELNGDIEEKRAYLEKLNRQARSIKQEIGYDASDIGAVLQTKMVNEDFSSAKCELEKLQSKLSDLVLQHKKLVGSN